MSLIAGIDYSTRAVDVVLLDEDSDRAEWHRFELRGADAFERARDVRGAFFNRTPRGFRDKWEQVVAVGIEEPRGHNAGVLYRIQGTILTCVPRLLLVQPWVPSAWRKQVGLPGNASKETVGSWVRFDANWDTTDPGVWDWPQDACDAYCIALATRSVLQREEKVA